MAESLLCELEAEAGKKHMRVSVLLIYVLSQQKKQKILRVHVYLHVNCYRFLVMERRRALGVACALSFTCESFEESLYFYRI